MQEISLADSFGQALAKYSDGLPLGVEIGGGTGDGSTQCIRTRELFSFEIHPDRIARHKYNLDGRQGGIAINQLSSNPMAWMTIQDVEQFYSTTKTNLNQYPLEQIIEWHKADFRMAAKFVWGHLSLKDEIDFLLLDGGAFSGRADFLVFFPKVREGGIIALDDTNDIKNQANYQWLKTAGYSILWEEPSFRNGCAIFRK
ncbi:hypothetical protein EBZ39_12240 [bacterium]|nr:hypothetical protein [bacterium]